MNKEEVVRTKRELHSKQNPDFTNVSLLIWAWSPSHLSQWDHAAKTPSQVRHIDTHGKTMSDVQIHNLIPAFQGPEAVLKTRQFSYT